MEIGLSDVESSQLSVRNPEAFLVDILVQTALHGQTRSRRRIGDQLNDHFMRHQRLAAPVLRDEREEPVLHTVPFARARRQMRNRDG